MAIGTNLKKILSKRSITLAEFSEMSGISKNTLYSITKRDPKALHSNTLNKITAALGITPEELLYKSAEEEYNAVDILETPVDVVLLAIIWELTAHAGIVDEITSVTDGYININGSKIPGKRIITNSNGVEKEYYISLAEWEKIQGIISKYVNGQLNVNRNKINEGNKKIIATLELFKFIENANIDFRFLGSYKDHEQNNVEFYTIKE